ncbi:uncharacterized protein LOC124135886 [Haliotis rufescens]|uniref:uncharacterized protein LOC124135886 n=1 Tax=Haliotis rufescens TaxID=6454 RepID=UPI00201EDEE6|nr:uncharacterized protein LOC124135886 [Haliotis rufescens]
MQAKTDACSYPLLRLCGDAAVRIYEDQTRNDTGCKNEPDTTVELSNGHTHRVDCSTTKGIQDGALDCLLYHGIYLEVPQLSSPEETTDYILKRLTVSRYRDMCSNMSAYHNAVSCTLAVLTQCSPSKRHLFADPYSTTLGMTSFCEHKDFDKFASGCVMNADQSTCEKWMVNSSTPEQMCSIIQTFTDCMKASVESCGPSTAELYTHLLSSQVPAPCVQGGRTTTPIPKSRAGKRVASMLMTVLAFIYSRVGVSQG